MATTPTPVDLQVAARAVNRTWYLAGLLYQSPDYAEKALIRVFGDQMGWHLYNNLRRDDDVARWYANLDTDNVLKFLVSKDL